MSLTTIALAGGVALIALAAAPYALPDHKTVERSAVIEATPDAIYPLLTSSAGFQTFNPYKDADPNLQITFDGPAEGIGAAFAFSGKDGQGTQTITHLEPNSSVTMQIDLGSMGQPVQTFTLEPVNGGTRVIWSVESQFGLNPIGRVFGLFLDSMLGETYERGLQNLSRVITNQA
ncbi:MAG: SRPBCC family protein [Pseudomonadota bacterium]